METKLNMIIIAAGRQKMIAHWYYTIHFTKPQFSQWDQLCFLSACHSWDTF